MSEEKKVKSTSTVSLERLFEQPSDAITFYSDLAQIINTGNEILLQFYESIPGPPTIDGNMTKVRSRLRATITISIKHAQNIGNLLIKEGKVHKA